MSGVVWGLGGEFYYVGPPLNPLLLNLCQPALGACEFNSTNMHGPAHGGLHHAHHAEAHGMLKPASAYELSAYKSTASPALSYGKLKHRQNSSYYALLIVFYAVRVIYAVKCSFVYYSQGPYRVVSSSRGVSGPGKHRCTSRFRDQTVHTAHQKMFLRKWGECPGRVPFRAIPPISAEIRYGERCAQFDPWTLMCAACACTCSHACSDCDCAHPQPNTVCPLKCSRPPRAVTRALAHHLQEIWCGAARLPGGRGATAAWLTRESA